ncbi:hypothetical protein WJX84_010611 [Apatococcus fuscideae]|uniref:Uncharacterized protein n=1 Tax=Apatococcus fuscideae TaxID=2026836 RepID=A0AAW1T2F1_9CHLO
MLGSFVARALKYNKEVHSHQSGMPFNDTYTSSKFAMEGFTECQATYLHRYGIQISLVEPGPILTNFVKTVEENHKLPHPDDAYSPLTPEFEKMMGEQFKDENMVQTPKEVAAVVVRVMEDYPKPHFRYQTSDFVKGAASDRWKDPTGYSMVHKYGRSTFSSQDVLP